jgi:hypothetical protein
LDGKLRSPFCAKVEAEEKQYFEAELNKFSFHPMVGDETVTAGYSTFPSRC